MKVHGYAAQEKGAHLTPVTFDRVDPRPGEIAIDITHCGVCHSDIHQVNDDWGNSLYPCLPGHEITGTVTAVGEGVEKFAVGDRVGVGCMVNSCQECDPCHKGDEQYCIGPKSATLTYNGPKIPDGTNTYGGYSTGIVVREEFVLRIPDALSNEVAAPILCAGITTYQPMKHFGLEKGMSIGIAGIGGLGHMAIQLAKALGAHPVALTNSPEKMDKVRELGADYVIDMTDEKVVEDAAQSLDMIISTIPYPHDLNPYVSLLKPDTKLIVVGNLMGFDGLQTGPMVMNRITVAGSLIGGIADTQEVLDLCAKHGIAPEIEVIAMKDINDAFDRMKGEDVRFRHVIDMASLKKDEEARSSAKEIDAPERGEVTGRKELADA
ncbi:NAD(P)-dependent alcohol dehydrogenase [Croceicoccus gelatinilyticus]|uniref:NAD(P)-dependent alcohol dehydrogenase n=1 Tax=Croceicoccus gelatinilyticus TaxID=2835536 RepID=UPI001BCB8FE7|nr:NAD(P)-dependent alcohol dehydrogenase [Croceicoccus gelatinilyticus]MBS7670312.1 NAD(P)-dependent alcohol dehydrogenase [Croceicoccus gelatinilyticus]